MKKSILNLLVLGALIIFFGSCSDDDEKPDGGSFTYDGEKITLKKGFTADWGYEEEGDDTYYYWPVTLTTDGIDFDEEEGNMIGSGDMVYFYIYGFNIGETELPLGTFNFDAEEGENGIEWAGVTTDFGTEEINWISVSSGQVKISKSGGKYVIEFSLTTSEDETVTGTFRGTLSYGYLPS